jgi:hypothetical protein
MGRALDFVRLRSKTLEGAHTNLICRGTDELRCRSIARRVAARGLLGRRVGGPKLNIRIQKVVLDSATVTSCRLSTQRYAS